MRTKKRMPSEVIFTLQYPLIYKVPRVSYPICVSKTPLTMLYIAVDVFPVWKAEPPLTFVARNSYKITMTQLNGTQQVFRTQKAPWYGSCQNLNEITQEKQKGIHWLFKSETWKEGGEPKLCHFDLWSGDVSPFFRRKQQDILPLLRRGNPMFDLFVGPQFCSLTMSSSFHGSKCEPKTWLISLRWSVLLATPTLSQPYHQILSQEALFFKKNPLWARKSCDFDHINPHSQACDSPIMRHAFISLPPKASQGSQPGYLEPWNNLTTIDPLPPAQTCTRNSFFSWFATGNCSIGSSVYH